MSKPIRVLVVDDSAFIRHTVSKHLGEDPQIKVVGQARDGLEALQQAQTLRPDVVTLDVEMPNLDGLATLECLMKEQPTPVVMLSSLTAKGADATVRALSLGAVDFVTKPTLAVTVGRVMEELIAKIKAAAASRVLPKALAMSTRPAAPPSRVRLSPLGRRDLLLILGTSTGGPRALYQVVPSLPADLPAAVLVVQHMPAGFTQSLANRLDHASPLQVKEANGDDSLHVGQALVAPGGYHLLVERGGRVALDEGPTVNGVRPSVDVTMESAVKAYGSRVVAVVLTGMGRDGTQGALAIKGNGGKVIAEDESTCVVYGMPKSVVESGAADLVVPLPGIATEIVRLVIAGVQEQYGRSRIRAGAAQSVGPYGN